MNITKWYNLGAEVTAAHQMAQKTAQVACFLPRGSISLAARSVVLSATIGARSTQ
jgi:hypothetical protein